MDGKHIRLILMSLWGVLYIVFVALFGTHLQSWDYNKPGHCYDTSKIALPSSSHPTVDIVYLSITCLYVFTNFIPAISCFDLNDTDDNPERLKVQLYVLGPVLGQLPLHIYFISAIRSVNEPLLNSGSSEQEWGFGQIVPMILLANNIIALIDGIQGLIYPLFSCL